MNEQAETDGLAFDDVTIDRDAEVPIGVQLAWAVRARIGDGRFKPGQQLPGLRELAETIGVNVNTVRAVYQRLEQEGLIDSQQGSGTFVASPRRPSAVATIAADAARAAHETGVEPREVAAALYVSPGPRTGPAGGAAERRRVLRQQIATLERTLVEIEAKHPAVAPRPTETRDVVGPTLLDAAELEQVQAILVRRLAIVQTAIDQLGSCREDASEEKPQAARRANAALEHDHEPALAGGHPSP